MDPFHNCKAKASFPVRQCVELTKVKHSCNECTRAVCLPYDAKNADMVPVMKPCARDKTSIRSMTSAAISRANGQCRKECLQTRKRVYS